MRGGNGRTSGGTLGPGFVAGLLGGVTMALWMVVSALAADVAPLGPLEALGDTFGGAEGRERNAATFVLGILMHLAFAGILGVLFVSVLPRDFPGGMAAMMCMGFAFVVMGFMTSLVLPAVNPPLRAEMPMLGGSWVIAHAVFGITVGYAGQRLRQRGGASAASRVPARAT